MIASAIKKLPLERTPILNWFLRLNGRFSRDWAICGGFAGSQFSKPVVEHCVGFWVERLPSWRGSRHMELERANLRAKGGLGLPRTPGSWVFCKVLYVEALGGNGTGQSPGQRRHGSPSESRGGGTLPSFIRRGSSPETSPSLCIPFWQYPFRIHFTEKSYFRIFS